MWDYIIVGAGTAGCVLARELSANPRNRVLLIEAGGKPPLLAQVPAGMVKLFKGKQDWNFESEPQAACAGRTIFVPRGKMLGGCANINAQVHQWCHPADFDGWVARGASGWGWNDVAPVFRAMERWPGPDTSDRQRGKAGPMWVEHPRLPCPLADAFVEAARAAGLTGQEDYNGCAYRGAWRTQQAHRHGRRFSAYHAYLKPAMRRSNLQVMTNSDVAAIHFNSRRAAGVRVRDGRTLAGAKVVLSAGSFGTPHLLMLSGVGPAQQLTSMGIEVVQDSPEIGENLQDHPLVGLNFRARCATLRSADTLGQLLKWLMFKRGMLSSNGIEAIAFTNILDSVAPDLELIFANLEWRNQGLEPPQLEAFALAAAVVSPRSRGRLTLRSANPADPPCIDLGLLSDAEGADRQVLMAGLRLARKIAATEPLASETDGELGETAWAQTDEELAALINRDIQTVYHPTGTCRMGSDETAPVEPTLKVRGCESLFVADASVMPTVPRGHPNAVVAMIAKRAAEWIEAADPDRPALSSAA